VRIDSVSLGPRAAGLGEAPGLQRVDLHKRKPARKRRLEAAVIRARRLEHDARHRRLAKPFYQSAKSRRRIIEALCCAIFQTEHVQMGFRYVHANGMLRHLRQSYPCHA